MILLKISKRFLLVPSYRDMLKLGSSQPWQHAMEKLTGQRKMDVEPLIEYFKPLLEWLKVQNQNETGGWMEECPSFLEKVDMESAKKWLQENNEAAQRERSKEGEVEWTYATNITEENSRKEVINICCLVYSENIFVIINLCSYRIQNLSNITSWKN